MAWEDWDEQATHAAGNHRGKSAGRVLLTVALLLLLAILILRARTSGEEELSASTETVAEVTAATTATLTSAPATAIPTNEPATATPTVVSTPVVPERTVFQPDSLAMYMLQLINAARASNGLNAVAWDETLAEAGRLHAEDMIANSYFSHWNLAGLGPEHRYSLAGGRHVAQENLHAYEYVFSDGRGAPIDDWVAVIENAHAGLMASPGHRANILQPSHTHVGIGMAYDPAQGQFRLAQEFGNHYVALSSSLPLQAEVGASIRVEGDVDNWNIDNILLNVAYEPFPEPLTRAQLAGTSTYSSAASETRDIRRLERTFSESVVLDFEGRSGIYHIRIFGDVHGNQALLLDHSIWVGNE